MGAPIRNPNANERLRAEFFRRYGKPLERVRGVRGARGGSIHQLYRDPDGKLIRLRTSMDGVLVTKAIGPNTYDAEAPVVLEGRQDFIGFAMPGPRGTVECFLIPKDQAIADFKEVHRRWLVMKPGGESDVRALFFYGEIEMHGKPWYGFQHLYAEYQLQAPKVPAASDDASMENLTVIIDRIEGSNVQEVRGAIEEVLAVLKPLLDRGLRIRITRSQQTRTEDKAWRAA
jgi:hypothetical protein